MKLSVHQLCQHFLYLALCHLMEYMLRVATLLWKLANRY